MTVLQKGCCCVELETCARIIGWLGVVFGLISTFGYFIAGYHWVSIIDYIVLGICHVIVSALLIKATKERKRNLVTPFLVVVILETIIFIGAQVNGLVQNPQEKDIMAANIFTLFAGSGLNLYFWLCIYSYYQLLSSNQNQK